MRIKVLYETTLGIYGPIGTRTVDLPRYVCKGQVSIWEYITRWLKRNVCEIARPLEWWRE